MSWIEWMILGLLGLVFLAIATDGAIQADRKKNPPDTDNRSSARRPAVRIGHFGWRFGILLLGTLLVPLVVAGDWGFDFSVV